MHLLLFFVSYLSTGYGRRVVSSSSAQIGHAPTKLKKTNLWKGSLETNRFYQSGLLESVLLAFNPAVRRQVPKLTRRQTRIHPTVLRETVLSSRGKVAGKVAARHAKPQGIVAKSLDLPTSGDETMANKPSSELEGKRGTRLEGQLLMLMTAILWGSNFPAVKATMDAGLSPSAAAAFRFSIAAVALFPMLKTEEKLPRDLLFGGLECGVWLAIGYIAQALALQDLPAGAVAFICALQVVLVPIINAFNGGSFTPRLVLAACLSLSGVGILEFGSMFSADSGVISPNVPATLLAFLQPLGFGMSYVRIEKFMRDFPDNGPQLSSLQLISNAAIAAFWCMFVSSGEGGFGADMAAVQQLPVLGGLLYTGLISTALTVLLQTRALGMVPASTAAVITSTEAFWAALLAATFFGEVLEPTAQIGGAMILLGCLADTLLPEDLA